MEKRRLNYANTAIIRKQIAFVIWRINMGELLHNFGTLKNRDKHITQFYVCDRCGKQSRLSSELKYKCWFCEASFNIKKKRFGDFEDTKHKKLLKR